MNENLIKSLTEFKNAYNNLLEEWDKNDVLNETDSIELYPFNKSFEEIQVNEWVDKTVKELTIK